jgi:hypothetical protein
MKTKDKILATSGSFVGIADIIQEYFYLSKPPEFIKESFSTSMKSHREIYKIQNSVKILENFYMKIESKNGYRRFYFMRKEINR